MLLWTWELGPYGKCCIFYHWKLDNSSLKPARKTHWFIFLFNTIASVKFWSFLKTRQNKTRLLVTSFWEVAWQHHFRVTAVPNQGKSRYGSQHSHNTLLWPVFSWNGTVYPMRSLHSFETTGKHDFVNLGTGNLRQKKYFPQYKLHSCSLKLARKT